MRYERIRFNGRTIILRDTTESELFLTGVEVDRTGMEVAPHGIDERKHIIDLTVITKRTPLTMNNHYGELEEV
jgi:hypothetical protein